MLDRQTYLQRELVVALHGYKTIDLLPKERSALQGARAVLELPGNFSLGRCINLAIAESRGIFIAKVDDDDLYAREYLAEAIKHLLAGDGDIVGKAETFVYLEKSGIILLKKPGAGLKSLKFVQGATLVFSRSWALQCPFRDITLREDTSFLEDSRLRGATIYSSSRKQFMCYRRAAMDTHTSILTDADFIKTGIILRSCEHATRADLLALIEK